jgi:hypothetical protein
MKSYQKNICAKRFRFCLGWHSLVFVWALVALSSMLPNVKVLFKTYSNDMEKNALGKGFADIFLM